MFLGILKNIWRRKASQGFLQDSLVNIAMLRWIFEVIINVAVSHLGEDAWEDVAAGGEDGVVAGQPVQLRVRRAQQRQQRVQQRPAHHEARQHPLNVNVLLRGNLNNIRRMSLPMGGLVMVGEDP